MEERKIKTGSDFSGVGAFDQALIRLGIEQDKKFACDTDKYARHTYCLNFGNENDIYLSSIFRLGKTTVKDNDYSFYYPKDVYEREIPKESLDIYMTSPPCQSFSLAGKRKGEDSKNGVLFYNSHEFIVKNNPRYFIFENVKGLLSDDNGKTFQRWIDYLGGKSVNGNPVIFPHENATPYHVYYQVLNAKHYGVPQNRERIFIIGIRDDEDNEFSFPKPFHLVKRLKDVLESEVDEKYFLSDKFLDYCYKHKEIHSEKGNGFSFEPKDIEGVAGAISTKAGSRQTDNYVETKINQPKVICFGRSETEKQRRKEVFQKTGKDSGSFKDKELIAKDQDYYDTLLASPNPQKEGLIMITAPIVEYQLTGSKWDKTHEQSGRVYDKNGIAPTIHTMGGGNQEPKVSNMQRIRRLTPFECFRLMDFNENFKWNVSDSQAYKQAGNSIVVGVLVEIISKLKLT